MLALALLIAQVPMSLGKTYPEIVGMGHRAWVRHAIQQAGESYRVEAERVYALALHDQNERDLRLWPGRQSEFDQLRSLFSDLAKSAFANGMARAGHSEAWALPIAESSTQINQALSDILRGLPRPKATFEEVQAAYLGLSPATAEERRFGHLLTEISKVQFRSSRAEGRAWGFARQMVRLMSHRPVGSGR